MRDYVEFNNISDFLYFLIDDLELEEINDDLIKNNDNYNNLFLSISSISDIKRIEIHFKFIDFYENGDEFFNTKNDVIYFDSFNGNF